MRNLDNIIKENIQAELNKVRKDVDKNPTDGQKEAGNYRKGHINILGFNITIENPKGSYRKGKDRNGKEWKTLMHNDYGYFVRTLGKDGDAIDVFIGPNLKSEKIFPIDQYVNGEFDETKVMLGFDSKEEAKSAYLSNYEKDWKGFKYITEVDIDAFKAWLYDGKKQRKPFAQYKTLNENMVLNESFNSPLLAKYAKEHGGLKVDRNGGLRSGVMAYQNGNKIDPAEVTDEMIYGTPFKFDWNSDNEYRETQFNNSIHFADGYAVLLRPHYSWDQDSVKISEPRKKANRYGSGIGDTGDHDKSRDGFVGNGKDALSAPYNGFSVSDRAGEGQMRREAWNNNLRDIKYWENAIKKLEAEIENEPDSRRIPALQYEIRSIKSKIANARENIDDIKSYSKELLKKKIDRVVAESIKRNTPKDVAAAIAKGNREADIELHGKPTAFRPTKIKSPKDYTRKAKHKEKINEYARELKSKPKIVSETQLRQIIKESLERLLNQ